jgi:dTDP-4-dehydrorhamnose 3,5-epimerase
LLVPAGYAHGFCVLSESATVLYKCDEIYVAEDDAGICWDDPALAIPWPVDQPVLSPKDAALPRLDELGPERLPRTATDPDVTAE